MFLVGAEFHRRGKIGGLNPKISGARPRLPAPRCGAASSLAWVAHKTSADSDDDYTTECGGGVVGKAAAGAASRIAR
jgi:hypothetical protein